MIRSKDWEYKWTILLSDGTLREGEGTERMLIESLKTEGIEDAEVYRRNSSIPKDLNFWKNFGNFN